MIETSTFLNKVDQTMHKYSRRDTLEQRKSKQLFNRWLESNQTAPFHFLLGNVSEFISDDILIDELEYYGIAPGERIDGEHYAIGANYGLGVKTKSDYQYNALFYKTLIKKKESSPYVGFRLVYTVESIK